MNNSERLSLFCGNPIRFNENCLIYSPTIGEISDPDFGEYTYSAYLLLSSFNKRKIYCGLLGISEQEFSQFDHINDFDFLTQDEAMCSQIEVALKFFTHEDVFFDPFLKKFRNEKGTFLDRENYKEFAQAVLLVNAGVFNIEEEPLPRFANKLAEEMYYKMLEIKNKEEAEKREADQKNMLELKDRLSILCNFDGNGINIFNIKDLTIFQAYEQYERMGLKESHSRALPVWANGYWDMKKHPFPEWMTKTKL